ncbi:hypothetical protein [Paraburkholderia heleia]|uniref:hypothetical protein n=1 Tax=Paraburkholderia heleia TaxID=634127 RepID=UPI0005A8E6B6|nr:hypothetical protein [Paraburkholderia heleia]
MKLGRRLAVEGAGNAWLMFAGRAAKALNTSPPSQGLHVFGMAAAFGLALTVANYAAARAASGRRGFSVAASDLGSNGYGDHLPADYALAAVYLMELTAPPLLGGAAAGVVHRFVSRRSRICATSSRHGV